MNIDEVVGAFRDALEDLDLQIYDWVPDAPIFPCLIIYPERIDYAFTENSTFVIWCIAGEVETQGAQAQLLSWLSDDTDDSIVEAIRDDNTLGDVVGSVRAVEVRNYGAAQVQEGRPRYLQAEIVFEVLPLGR